MRRGERGGRERKERERARESAIRGCFYASKITIISYV